MRDRSAKLFLSDRNLFIYRNFEKATVENEFDEFPIMLDIDRPVMRGERCHDILSFQFPADEVFGAVELDTTVGIDLANPSDQAFCKMTEIRPEPISEDSGKSGSIVSHGETPAGLPDVIILEKSIAATPNGPKIGAAVPQDPHLPPYPEAALPALTFKDALTLYFNGDEIQVTHIPHAHSDADIVIYFRKANVIHTGDLCFSSGYPFIDVAHGGSTNGMVEAADTILKIIDANTKLIPGHGPLTNREGLQKFRDMLAAVRDRIAKLVKEGKTLEEVLASKPTADFDKDRKAGMPSDLLVKIIYGDQR